MSTLFKNIIYICIILFITTTNAYALQKLKIAVIDFTPDKRLSNEANIVSDMLEIKLFKYGYYQLLERKNIDAIIKQKGLHNKCSNEDCIAEIGRDLSADIILTISLTKTTGYTINYKLINVTDNKVLTADFQKAQNKEELENGAAFIAKQVSDNYNDIIINKHFKNKDTYPSIIISFGSTCDPSYLSSFSFLVGLYSNNLFIQNFSLGIQYEYLKYEKKPIDIKVQAIVTNITIEESANGNSLLLSTRYALNFQLNQSWSFKIYPYFSCGILRLSTFYTYYNTLFIPTADTTINKHTDIIYTLLFKPGLFVALSYDKSEIFIGYEYMTNFKLQNKDLSMFKISLGAQYSF